MMERNRERQIAAKKQGIRSGTTGEDYRLTVMQRDLSAAIEKIEVLNGDRKRALPKSAIKRGEISVPVVQAKLIPDGTSITTQQYNILVRDIQAIVAAMSEMNRT